LMKGKLKVTLRFASCKKKFNELRSWAALKIDRAIIL
jgi:hypothetical protein